VTIKGKQYGFTVYRTLGEGSEIATYDFTEMESIKVNNETESEAIESYIDQFSKHLRHFSAFVRGGA
jgi:hypothetical protein